MGRPGHRGKERVARDASRLFLKRNWNVATVREKVGVRRSGRLRPESRLKLHTKGRCVEKFVVQ